MTYFQLNTSVINWRLKKDNNPVIIAITPHSLHTSGTESTPSTSFFATNQPAARLDPPQRVMPSQFIPWPLQHRARLDNVLACCVYVCVSYIGG